MGNQIMSDEELSESFQQQYTFNEKPYILQKSTGKPFTIHKITTNSPEETKRTIETVEKYKHSKCACISKLKQHYYKQNKSYCSDRENIYFLFHDHGKNTIKDEYLMRRYTQHKFKPQQIQLILTTMLCGIKQYHNNFGRVHKPMALQNVCIQPKTHRLYVKDPWLCQTSTIGSFTNVMLTYPSPEKLNALYEDKESFYDQYNSQLFTIGILGLQLHQMQFVDEIYNSKRKNIDNEKLMTAIQSLPNECNLKSGIRTLLQQKPARRGDIFHEWKINCLVPKILEHLQKDIDRQILDIQGDQFQKRNSFMQNNAGQVNSVQNSMKFQKNPQDFRSSDIFSNSNHIQRVYSHANSGVSATNSHHNFYIPKKVSAPIKSDQFDSSLKKMEGSNIQYRKPDHSRNIITFVQKIEKTDNPSFSGSLYSNKSASNLLNISNNIPIDLNKLNHGGNHLNTYNFRRSKAKESTATGSSNNFMIYRPQLHIETQKKSIQTNFGNGQSSNSKLLSIKRPGNYTKFQNQKKVVVNTANFNKVIPRNQGNDPMINSFNTHNSVKFGSQINAERNVKFNIGSSLNKAQNQNKNESAHYSSLQKYGKKDVPSNLHLPSSLLDSRPRSISNQQNHNFGVYSLQNVKNKQLSQFESSKQKWSLDNRVAVNKFQVHNINIINNENGVLSIKDASRNQVKQSEDQNKYEFYFENFIKTANPDHQSNAHQSNTLTKREQETNKSVKNQQTKSPINEWKVSEEQKKMTSPEKPQRIIQSPQKIIKPIQVISQVESASISPQSEKQPGIYSDIKTYAETFFSFKTNQTTAESITHNKPPEVDQNQQNNFQVNHLNPNNNSKQTTPARPTNKNKYNSTIVQVNQETPEASQSSNQGQVEYVIEQYQTGSRYEGQKINGMRSGKGKFYYQDGGHYEGEWKNNKMHGWGKLFYQGGRLAYQGHWSHDEFHGYGKVYNDNPIPVEGPFDYTNFDLLDDFWVYYEGTLVSDTKEGRGKIKLTNGQVFEGDFHADRIQGFGKYYTNDGNFIEGIWRESKLIKVLQTS